LNGYFSGGKGRAKTLMCRYADPIIYEFAVELKFNGFGYLLREKWPS